MNHEVLFTNLCRGHVMQKGTIDYLILTIRKGYDVREVCIKSSVPSFLLLKVSTRVKMDSGEEVVTGSNVGWSDQRGIERYAVNTTLRFEDAVDGNFFIMDPGFAHDFFTPKNFDHAIEMLRDEGVRLHVRGTFPTRKSGIVKVWGPI